MKLILSRKGFDSQSGGCPSPIFPDGTLYSVPIPGSYSKIKYGDLRHGDTNIGEMVENLTSKYVKRDDYAHLDPDLNSVAYPRQEDWAPLFGQAGAAQGHLRNQGVQINDLFLFFGLFRRVEKTAGRWCFVKETPKQHILWGWLQIGEIRKIDELVKDELPWAHYHHHLQYPKPYPSNTLYIAADRLDLDHSFKGAGQFPKLHPDLVLTQPGKSASYWQLPRCFYPDYGKTPLSYHGNCNWKPNDGYVYVQRRGPGQEFVLDLDQYPGVKDWLVQSIFTHNR